MKIAANLSLLFTELPLAERILAARVAGFDGVEIQFPYEVPAIQLREQLERAGLPLVLINLPAGDLMQGGPGLAVGGAEGRNQTKKPTTRRTQGRPHPSARPSANFPREEENWLPCLRPRVKERT